MNCAIHTDTPAVAFCRTCGKALCASCKRDVMGAIYCEPCIAARLQSAPGVTPVVTTVVSGAPSPALAALLGFIPGVGAMYNGQFVKAFIHVVIFACLIMLASHVHGLFGLLIGFFVLYMAFEAHQTAKAKQLGQQPPDFLGLDHLFGIQEGQPQATPAAPVTETPAADMPGGSPAQTRSHEPAPTGAIVLVVLGVFFLLENFGILRIDRIWPLFLIVLGLWIAYKRTAERT
jgi:Domain of unknown function (DUF5668)/B-box zinc finger